MTEMEDIANTGENQIVVQEEQDNLVEWSSREVYILILSVKSCTFCYKMRGPRLEAMEEEMD